MFNKSLSLSSASPCFPLMFFKLVLFIVFLYYYDLGKTSEGLLQ